MCKKVIQRNPAKINKKNAATAGKRLEWKWTMDTRTKQVYYSLHLITVTTLQSHKNANADSNR